jgi:hypothetical protein
LQIQSLEDSEGYDDIDDDFDSIPVESRLSRILNEKTTQVVILMILLTLLLLPLLELSMWNNQGNQPYRESLEFIR